MHFLLGVLVLAYIWVNFVRPWRAARKRKWLMRMLEGGGRPFVPLRERADWLTLAVWGAMVATVAGIALS